MIVWGFCAMGAEKSQTIVYINGTKYYLHIVQSGETLYALSKLYNVDKNLIIKYNPSAANGLKTAESIKIPVPASQASRLSEKKLRKTFDTHFVADDETLYSIARLYEISIKTIMEDNPELDPTRLRPGQKLLIRKKKKGKEDEAATQAQWEAYRDDLNTVKCDSVNYHIVRKGDTFYSLAKNSGITQEELSRLNNGLQAADLKVGAMIRLPDTETDPRNEQSEQQPQADTTIRREIPRVEFHSLRSTEKLKVALLLPISVNAEKQNSNYIEFYKGFLMGLDSVKHQHRKSVEVTLYNTGRNAETIETILQKPEFEGTRLIIGPVYESELYPVIRYAERKEIPVVSPLAHIEALKSDALFQMAPAIRYKYEKVADLVGEGKQVTLIYSNGGTDQEFEKEMLALLGDKPYRRFQYKYAHPSMQAANAHSQADLTPLLENKEDNTFIIMSNNEIDVDRILAALASADTNLKARGNTAPRFKVLGNVRWNRYNNLDKATFFKNRVVFISTYHAKRDAEVVCNFDKAYLQAFGELPSLFSYRGYDAAKTFCPAMYNDIEYDMEDRRYTPLQTTYLFKQEEDDENHVNKNWTRVNYNDNFTITIE